MNQEEFDAQCAHWNDEELVEWFRGCNDDEDLIALILDAEEEISDGGLIQFYKYGEIDAKKLAHCLRTLGELERAQIIIESLSRFPNGVQPRRMLDEFGEPLDPVEELVGGPKAFRDLDDRFHNLPETLAESLGCYVRKNLGSIYKGSGLEIELDFYLENNSIESELQSAALVSLHTELCA
jgi:hypothetical protein